MRYLPRLAAPVVLSTAALALAVPPANAASAASSCSAVVPYGKQICLGVDQQTVTATLVVQSGGRGWYGEVEIDGPAGELVRTGNQLLSAPANWNVSHPAAGTGRYCAVDWRWDVYHQDYFVENSVCVTTS
ncbi:hypothetical protein ACIGXM_33680 [Kitasatospora sp. NPDC052896]|uniref:hypothetical protein n=1 Tax=Kitasatospora sp. NPDC052896 TaxID=3364061 RepID=UPI0037C9926A